MADYDLQVFISSIMRNNTLKAERAAAVEAVDKVSGFCAWHWEKCGPAGPNTPMSTCLAAVEASDALILLIGYGLTKNTIDEHKLAVKLKKPDFIFIKQGRCKKETKAYIKKHEKRATYRVFNSIDELKTMIATSLQHERARRFREYPKASLGARAPYAKAGGARRNG